MWNVTAMGWLALALAIVSASNAVVSSEDVEMTTSAPDTSQPSRRMYVPDNICFWNDSVPQNELMILCHCDGFMEQDFSSADFNCWIVAQMHDEDAIWDAFGRQKNLTTLTFNLRQDGKLEFIPRKALQHMPNMVQFKVNHASIPRIRTRDFSNMQKLGDIRLSACEIKKLDKQAFYNLTSLQTLDLSHNRIERIRRNVFHMLPRLEKVYLDRNGLKELEPGCFKELANLTQLELWKNEISNITDKTFKNLRRLEKLDLSQNLIEYIPNYPFQDLESLRELNLDDNSVRFIDEFAFFGLSKLVTLNLQDNKLVNLGQGLFYYTPSLMVLDLRQNVLETLQFHTIESLASNFNNASFTMILKENNLQCDCRLEWVYKAFNKTASQFLRQNLEQLKCYLAVEYLEDLLPHVASEDPAQIADPKSDHTDRYDDVSVYRTTTFSLGAHVRLLDLKKDKLPCPTATRTTGPGVFDEPSTVSGGSTPREAKTSSPSPVAVSQTNRASQQREMASTAASATPNSACRPVTFGTTMGILLVAFATFVGARRDLQ